MLDVTPIPALRDNYIWLIHGVSDPGSVAIVDPGEAQPVTDALEQLELQPRAILLTHKHWDHVSGVEPLVHANPGLPVYGPRHEAVPCLEHPLADGDRVELASMGLTFEVMDVPGHTLEHIALVGHGAVFAGDTLFACGCGRVFEGTAEMMVGSLDRLAALPDATRLYCGHEYTVDNLRFARAVEPHDDSLAEAESQARARRAEDRPTLPTSIAEERRLNPFLRCDQASIREACGTHAGRSLDDRVDTFAVLRRWKDGFG